MKAAVLTESVSLSRPRLADYAELTKPRVALLVLFTVAIGALLATRGVPFFPVLFHTLLGTALVAGGAAALNQVYERDTDALMRRTRMRPLPDGRVSPAEARVYGLALAAVGVAMLAARANGLAAGLALVTLAIYLVVYTPLKRRSPAATLVGAIPGALPPLIGWTASHGRVSAGGLALFAIVFLWQIPHFMAIAWLYRDDYGKAGFPMLPVIDPDGGRTARQALLYAAALWPVSFLPAFTGVAGNLYLACAAALGAALLWLAIRFKAQPADRTARALFIGSITYLPLLWMVIIVNSRQ